MNVKIKRKSVFSLAAIVLLVSVIVVGALVVNAQSNRAYRYFDFYDQCITLYAPIISALPTEDYVVAQPSEFIDSDTTEDIIPPNTRFSGVGDPLIVETIYGSAIRTELNLIGGYTYEITLYLRMRTTPETRNITLIINNEKQIAGVLELDEDSLPSYRYFVLFEVYAHEPINRVDFVFADTQNIADTGMSLNIFPVNLSTAFEEIVKTIHQPFSEIVDIIMFAPGLERQPLSVVDGKWIGAVEYDGGMYVAIEDERFPHIQTVQDIYDKALTIFTEEFFNKRFYYSLHPEYSPFREIDGILHTAIVDGVNLWIWDTDTIKIQDYSQDSFVAFAPLNEWNYIEGYNALRMTFVLTPEGWRIDDVEYCNL